MRIIIFGDSIAEGMWDYEVGGWVQRLKLDYWNNYGYNRLVYNFGISSYTSKNVYDQCNSAIDSLCRIFGKDKKEAIVVFAIGINDASSAIGSGENKVGILDFSENIKNLINTCQNNVLVQNVIFISAINIDEQETNRDVSRWRNHAYYNSEIKKYNSVIQKLAIENTCGYIDLFASMKAEDFEDGLHPNTQGHEKMYKKIKEYLDKKL